MEIIFLKPNTIHPCVITETDEKSYIYFSIGVFFSIGVLQKNFCEGIKS